VGDSVAEAEQPPGYRDTVVAAACLGLVYLGDALIYVVLPLYPAAFGVEITAVAILLSVNRVVRILGYGWVSPLARRFGARTLTAWACAAAALSTLCYGLASGFALLFIARAAWGAAFGVLNLTNTAYAYGDGHGAATRIGLSRAISALGIVLALGLGGWLVTLLGPQQVFVVYGLVGLPAIGLALLLPRLRQTVGDVTVTAHRRWTPSSLNILFFVVALGADGVFAATLSTLLADILPVTAAVIGAGLLLAAHRIVQVLLSLASGPIIDQLEVRRVIVPCSLALAAGLLAIALGQIYLGAAILILARAAFAVIAPVIAAGQSTDRIGALAAYATWSDCGLAAGAFIGIVGMEWAGYGTTYALLAAATVGSILWFMLARTRSGKA
jgi:predicted MFS family arabinose efflux permease